MIDFVSWSAEDTETPPLTPRIWKSRRESGWRERRCFSLITDLTLVAIWSFFLDKPIVFQLDWNSLVLWVSQKRFAPKMLFQLLFLTNNFGNKCEIKNVL